MTIKFLGQLLFLTILSQIFYAESAFAAADEDYYRGLLGRRFGVELSQPPVSKISLTFSSPGSASPPTGSLEASPLSGGVEFSLREPIDFLVVALLIGRPYLPGRITLQYKSSGQWREIWRGDFLQPEVTISHQFDPGDFRFAVEPEDKNYGQDVSFTVKALRYRRSLDAYSNNEWYLFLSSHLANFDKEIESIFRQRRILLFCDESQELDVSGIGCRYDKLRTSPADHTIFRNVDGESLLSLTAANRQATLVSPRIFSDDAGVEALRKFISRALAAQPVPLKIDWGSLGRLVLDYYRGILTSAWFTGLIKALALLILVFILRHSRSSSFTAQLIKLFYSLLNYLSTLISRVRGLFLSFFLVSSLALLLTYSSSRLVNTLRDFSPVYQGYLYFKGSLAETLTFNDLRHIVEAIFMTLALSSLILSFPDKILLTPYRALRLLVKSGKPRAEVLGTLILIAWTTLILSILLDFPRMIIFSMGTAFFFGLLIWQLRSFPGEQLEPVRPALKTRWRRAYFLLLLVSLAYFIWENFFLVSPTVFVEGDFQGLTPGSPTQLVSLPRQTQSRPSRQGYESLWIRPSRALFANDYLLYYPGASEVVYLTAGSKLEAEGAGPKAAIYVREDKSRSPTLLEKLKYLEPLLSREKFKNLPSVAVSLRFAKSYENENQHFFFYAHLPNGRNFLEIDYRDLNLTPRSATAVLKVFGVEGELAAESHLKSSQYFQVGRPQLKTLRHEIIVPQDDLYLVEIFFEDEPSSLAAQNLAYLETFRLWARAVYFFDPAILTPFAEKSQRLAVTVDPPEARQSPFVFELVDFGDEAQTAIALGFEEERTITVHGGEVDLGEILNGLPRPPKRGGPFLINYGERREFLTVVRMEKTKN